MQVGGIGGSGWDNRPDYDLRRPLSPAESAEIERRQAEVRAERLRETQLSETRTLVGEFVKARSEHVGIEQALVQQAGIVSRLKSEADSASKPQGLIESLVAGLLAVLGLSPAARYSRALRMQSQMQQREREARERRSRAHRMARVAAARHSDLRWRVLDEEDGIYYA